MGNNLYSNLVNFYNVNDENFKEFMAELYKEMLITHRDVQYVKKHLTEEIEKKLEIYLVDGKFNINIEEKVNEFLENNQEIEDINTKLNTNTNNLKNITSQLDTIVQENNSYIINPLYPPEGYEGISEDSEDNKNALEILLNDFKNITLPKGKFYISSLEIPSNSTLKGSGKDTILISTLNNVNTKFIYTNEQSNRINIENLCIDGNNQNLTLLYINRINGVFDGIYDCNHYINDIILQNGENGMIVDGYARACDFNRVIISKINKNGLEINTTDCNYTTFNISECGEKALVLNKNNNRISNIKTYVNGYNLVDSYSFYINSDGNTINNIEIQDASYNGVELKGNYNKITNLFIDGCGYTKKVSADNSISLKVTKRNENVYSCFNIINGVIYNGVGDSYGKYGLFIDGNGSYFNNINMLISDNRSKFGTMPLDFSPLKYDIVNFTNSITVNNETENYKIIKINDSTPLEKVADIPNTTINISNDILNFDITNTIGITKGYTSKALINVLTSDIDITNKKSLTVKAKFKTNNKNVYGSINFFIREKSTNKFVTLYGSNLYKSISSEYQEISSCLDLTNYSNIETLKICFNVTKSDEIEANDSATCNFKDIYYSIY